MASISSQSPSSSANFTRTTLSLLGTSLDGRRIAARILDYFPYFYAELPATLGIGPGQEDEFAADLANTIEAVYSRSPNYLGKVIERVEIISRLSIYGYRKEPAKMLKISLARPELVAPIARMMSEGCFFEHKFQAYEADLDFFTQFRASCGLLGTDLVLIHISPTTLREDSSIITGVSGILNKQMQELSTGPLVPVAIPKVLHLDGFLPEITPYLKACDSDPRFDLVAATESLESCANLFVQALFKHPDRHSSLVPMVYALMSASHFPGLYCDEFLRRSAEGAIVFPVSKGVTEDSAPLSSDEEILSAVTRILDRRPPGKAGTGEAAPCWRSRGKIDENLLKVRRCDESSFKVSPWDNVKWQERALLTEACDETLRQAEVGAGSEKDVVIKRRSRKEAVKNNVSIADYFSDSNNSDNLQRPEIRKIYKVFHKTVGVKLYPSHKFPSAADLSQIRCYEANLRGPSSSHITKKSKCKLSRDIHVHFSRREDYEEYLLKTQSRHSRVACAVRMRPEVDVPEFARNRKTGFKYEEVPKVRKEVLYECPRLKHNVYCMNSMAPSSKSISSRKTNLSTQHPKSGNMSPAPETICPKFLSHALSSLGLVVYCDVAEFREYDSSIDPIKAVFFANFRAGIRTAAVLLEVEVCGKLTTEADLIKEFLRIMEECDPATVFSADDFSFRFLRGRAERVGSLLPRVPCMSPDNTEEVVGQSQLFGWYHSGAKEKLCHYFTQRLENARKELNLDDMMDLIQMHGLDPYNATIQSLAESLILNAAHRLNFVLSTPNPQNRINQPPREILPFSVGPERQFFSAPVIVLRVHSLYPSVMLSHNLCYSTCIGKVRSKDHRHNIVADSAKLREVVLGEENLPEADIRNIIIAPNDLAFVKPCIRAGVIPRLLHSISATKKFLVSAPHSSTSIPTMLKSRISRLESLADALPKALRKLMPFPEFSDSLAAIANSLLESVVHCINSRPGCRVIFANHKRIFVSSLGIKLPPFEEGREIIGEFPGLEISVEKVFAPLLSVSRGHYAGMAFRGKDQAEPELEIKGLDTLRDGEISCGIARKVLEKVLKKLFTQGDLSEIRRWIEKQWTKLETGTTKTEDLILRCAKGQNHLLGKENGQKLLYYMRKQVLSGALREVLAIFGVDPDSWLTSYLAAKEAQENVS